jgi:hypothetical protein
MRYLGGVVICALIAVAGPAAAQPATVVVAEPDTIGVEPAAGATFAELLRDGLRRQGYTVPARSQTPPEPCGDPACGAALAARVGTQSAVVARLSRLEARVIVNVEHVGADGRLLYSDRITAGSLDDLDPLSTRIAAGIATGQPLGDTATVSTVTDEEARDPVRRKALFTSGVRLGAAIPVAGSYGGAGWLTDLGFFGFFELSQFAAVLEIDLRWTGDSNQDVSVFGFSFDFGGRYFLDPEAPTGVYVGGGLGFRAVAVDRGADDDGASGLGGYVGTGVVFLRTSDLHILLDARYDVAFFRLNELDADRRVHAAMVSIGLSYTKWGGWGLGRLF